MIWLILLTTTAFAASRDSPMRELIWAACVVSASYTLAPRFWVRALQSIALLYHETGHVLAAIVSGGRSFRLVVHGGGGMAWTAGGWRPLVLVSGYLFPFAFGAACICWGQFAPNAGRLLVLALA